MKQKLIFTLLLLSGRAQCSNTTFLQGTRAGEISEFFNGAFDIINIIGDYDTDSCLESRSKKYYAYVHNPYQWNSIVVLCNRRGAEVKRFYANYVRAIALSPHEDIIIVMHEESKGYWREGSWYQIPYRYITANLFWRSLALTGFSIKDAISHTIWPSSYTQRRLAQVDFFKTFPSDDGHPSNPVLLPISGPLRNRTEQEDPIEYWPDISQARIKRMRIADDETFRVTLYKPIPLLNLYNRNITPTTCTRKLVCFRPILLGKDKTAIA